MGRMPPRVIALLLAFVLLWSGIGTVEVPRSIVSASPEPQLALAEVDGQDTVHQGSVDDHHLDDLPAQAQGDAPPETPGLLPAPLTPNLHGGLLTEPRRLASVAFASTFLAGPLRPPCAAPFAG